MINPVKNINNLYGHAYFDFAAKCGDEIYIPVKSIIGFKNTHMNKLTQSKQRAIFYMWKHHPIFYNNRWLANKIEKVDKGME